MIACVYSAFAPCEPDVPTVERLVVAGRHGGFAVSAGLKRLAEWCSDPFVTVEVEIGSSYGDFLCELAARNPDVRFAGIEIVSDRYESSMRKSTLGLAGNVVFVHGDAVDIVRERIPGMSISTFHIYFPSKYYLDLRGRRRRLITAEFAGSVYAALKNGGGLRVLTDQADYFDNICDVFGHYGFWSCRCKPLPLDLPEGFLAGTPLEYQYRPLTGICALHLVK